SPTGRSASFSRAATSIGRLCVASSRTSCSGLARRGNGERFGNDREGGALEEDSRVVPRAGVRRPGRVLGSAFPGVRGRQGQGLRSRAAPAAGGGGRGRRAEPAAHLDRGLPPLGRRSLRLGSRALRREAPSQAPLDSRPLGPFAPGLLLGRRPLEVSWNSSGEPREGVVPSRAVSQPINPSFACVSKNFSTSAGVHAP